MSFRAPFGSSSGGDVTADAMRKRAATSGLLADQAALLTFEGSEARRRQHGGLGYEPSAFSSDAERAQFNDLAELALMQSQTIAHSQLQSARFEEAASLQAATNVASPTATRVSSTMLDNAVARNAAATAAASTAGGVPVLEVLPRVDNATITARATELARFALAGPPGDSPGNDEIRRAAAQVVEDVRASQGSEIRRQKLCRAFTEMLLVVAYDSAHHRDSIVGFEYRVLMKAEITKAEQDDLYPVPNAFDLPRRTTAAELARSQKVAKTAAAAANKRSFFVQQQSNGQQPFFGHQAAPYTPPKNPNNNQGPPKKKSKPRSNRGGGGGNRSGGQ